MNADHRCHGILINQNRARNYPLFSVEVCISIFHIVPLIAILYP